MGRGEGGGRGREGGPDPAELSGSDDVPPQMLGLNRTLSLEMKAPLWRPWSLPGDCVVRDPHSESGQPRRGTQLTIIREEEECEEWILISSCLIRPSWTADSGTMSDPDVGCVCGTCEKTQTLD